MTSRPPGEAPSVLRARGLAWVPPGRAEPLFAGLDLDLRPGDRLGVVGPNGCGKTTLLALLAGRLEPHEGRVKAGAAPWLLPQAPPPTAPGVRVEDALLALDPALAPLRRRLRAHEAAVAPDGDAYARDLAAYGEAGGWSAEVAARAEAERLGLGADALLRPADVLSGGERRMLHLASILARGPRLLLLDEPSEALDEAARTRLEARLAGFGGALVLASHDRSLLNAATTSTLAFEHDGPRLVHAPYDDYRAAHDAERAERERRAATSRREIAHLEAVARGYATWGGRKEKEKSGALDRGFVGARAARLQRRAVQARRRREGEIRALREAAPWVEPEYRLPLPEPSVRRGTIVSLHAAGARLGEREPFAPIDLSVAAGERVAIVGPNGAGKSTLLALLAGRIAPTRGRIHRHPRARTALLTQHPEADPHDDRRAEALFAASETAEARRRLGALGFGEAAWRVPLSDLSGGQRQKLRLVRRLADAPDVLLLDEPTTFLDLPATERLEAALAGWAGTIVLVSHDRAFRAAVATREVGLDGTDGAG